MTAGSLSARDRLTLAVGIAVCGSIVGVGRGLPALRMWEGARLSAAAEAEARVARVEMAARLASAAQSGAARAQAARVALDSLTILAATPAEAGAALSLLLGAYADTSGVRVVSSAIRADSAFIRGFATARVQLTAVAEIDAVMAMLELVEGGPPILAVRELLATRGDAAVNGAQTLRVEMAVEVLVRKSDAPGGGAP